MTRTRHNATSRRLTRAQRAEVANLLKDDNDETHDIMPADAIDHRTMLRRIECATTFNAFAAIMRDLSYDAESCAATFIAITQEHDLVTFDDTSWESICAALRHYTSIDPMSFDT